MCKPICNIKISSPNDKATEISALFDSGSYYTLIHNDKLQTKQFIPYNKPKIFGTAAKGGGLKIIGSLELIIEYGGKKINTLALVSSDLSREMIVGAITMQEWDIVIKNKKGKTRVLIGKDMRDPDILEVA